MLSNVTIRRLVRAGVIQIEPFNDANVQACSYDMTLGDVALTQHDGVWVIPPHAFVLASTREFIHFPSHVAGTLQGKSTQGRRGLVVEDAGHFDPGFRGEATLELCNQTREPILLRVGEPIAQMIFTFLDEPADPPYHGRYVGQTAPTPARDAPHHELLTFDRFVTREGD